MDVPNLNTVIPCPSCGGHGTVDVAPMVARAAAKTTVTASGCWEYRAPRPYARLIVRNLALLIHHLGFVLEHGLPEQHVLHTCDNGRCWNPSHLYDGSPAQNNHDRRARALVYGRAGADNHFARLTADQVAVLQQAAPMSWAEKKILAGTLGVHVNTVHRITAGKSWRADTRKHEEGES